MGFSDLKRAIKKIDESFKQRDKPQDAPPPIPPRNYVQKQVDVQPQPEAHQQTRIDGDIFDHPIEDSEPPAIFSRVQHNQLPKGAGYGPSDQPIQTNNFYNNLTLEDQTFPVWTQPYSLWLTKEPGQDFGFAFNHTDRSQQVFGPEPQSNPAQFYFNPPRIQSFVISAEGFSPENTRLVLEDHAKLSVTSRLVQDADRNITLPLVHGMGYVTALYQNLRPIISSQVGVQEFSKVGNIGPVAKYQVKLFNQVVWSLYITGDINLELKDPNHILGDRVGTFTLQWAKGSSKFYDQSAGSYPTDAELHGSSDGDKGTYQFKYNTAGNSQAGSSIIWALPHHYQVLDDSIKSKEIDITLDSTVKGVMKGYVTSELLMEEKLPLDINWEPWASFSTHASYPDHALELIKSAAIEDIKQDVVGMANIDSMYTSGKILDKFAYIAYVCKFILNDDELTNQILPRLQEAIEIFARNQQKYPLVYDGAWKGLISSAEPGADFGNANYNDHQFHYGYHIHAIALVSKIDDGWLRKNDNLVLNYANTLLRDVANPKADKYFPQSRSFDWYHGHSFAHGIFASGDGKDEESSSEDYHFAYGMKLYAQILRDPSMEARANLMLAVMKRSMGLYMLYTDDNEIQPANFIKNKVAGITFENKIDFSTYFGRGTIADEWIHGIHMLPITPISSYIRTEQFVKEEWQQKLAGIIDQIPDGWKGILMLNLALYDPKKAWDWFSRNDWDDRLIDNGMSRTWSLAFISGIGGAN
ncbi:glycoside hydrolase family 81 protein [Suhomyces tanzawaensis NRRL Y-17324]|uniref:glucan endo-1,3-beta-D-glucosidase n=1 Tax=Suhomyces tanzawaensis NRRL Y-17324 TaxID=984487 RepID=A0A1E4SB30_9ASCO|nr:glycoside hydrolase family 81 protein [Suhomyces tanzawaensis NRRL Y-17324]ODV76730.1 glycoside hydrolase family 81 protein [Suhomyces tanzawaensis NRRL Y-17324]